MSIPKKSTLVSYPISLNKYEIKKPTEIRLWLFWHWDTLDEDDFNCLFLNMGIFRRPIRLNLKKGKKIINLTRYSDR